MTLFLGLVRPSSWHRSTSARAALASVVTLSLALVPATALAHDDLERAKEHAAEADFDAALTSFEAALDSGELSREELIALLAERILVLHAVGKKQQLDDDLNTLVMLGGEDALDRRAPPQLVDALATKKRARQQSLSFEARCEPTASGSKIHARVNGLSGNAPVTLRIHVRGDAERRWSTHVSTDVELSSDMGKEVAYYGELVGFNGVVLASAGSVDMPRTCTAPAEPRIVESHAARPAEEEHEKPAPSRKKWWWVGAGSVLAIGAVTVAVLATRDSDPESRSAVSNPMVEFE